MSAVNLQKDSPPSPIQSPTATLPPPPLPLFLPSLNDLITTDYTAAIPKSSKFDMLPKTSKFHKFCRNGRTVIKSR